MIKKYFALSLITVSLLAAGCSSDDDDDDGSTDNTDAGMTDGDVDAGVDGGADGDVDAGVDGGADGDVDGGADGDVDAGVDGGMDAEPVSAVNPNAPPADMADGSSAYDVIANSTDHTVLLAAIDAADLADTLDDPAVTEGFTIFAPTDAAFEAAFAASGTTAADLTEQAITYHVVAGTQTDVAISDAVTAAEATPDTPFTLDSVAGPALTFELSDTAPAGISVVDGVDVSADLGTGIAPGGDAGVGLVYSIDMVLTAPVEDVDGGGTTDGGTDAPVVGEVTEGDAQAALVDDGDFTQYLGSFDASNFDQNPWTVIAIPDSALAAAGVTDINSIGGAFAFISTAAALDEAALAATTELTTGSATYAVATDADGNTTVGGAPVALFATGAAGAQVYTTTGVPEAN